MIDHMTLLWKYIRDLVALVSMFSQYCVPLTGHRPRDIPESVMRIARFQRPPVSRA